MNRPTPATPTLTIVHKDRDEEVIAFACEHGETHQHSVTDSAEAVNAVQMLVMLKHSITRGCVCEPLAFEDYWPSAVMALAQYSADAATPSPVLDSGGQTLHALIVEGLRHVVCPSCEPGAMVRISADNPNGPRLTMVHAKECDAPSRDPKVIFTQPEGRA